MSDRREHPAPDLLAALPQGSLTEKERSNVLSHLAECAACRHSVLFLVEAKRHHQPESKRRAWRPFAAWATAAAAIAFFFVFTSYHRADRSKNQSIAANAVYPTAWRIRSFQHVKLTRPSDSAGTDALTIHLAGFKPKENQVVVRSQYGDRWLTFDSFLSLATNDGSVSTVN